MGEGGKKGGKKEKELLKKGDGEKSGKGEGKGGKGEGKGKKGEKSGEGKGKKEGGKKGGKKEKELLKRKGGDDKPEKKEWSGDDMDMMKKKMEGMMKDENMSEDDMKKMAQGMMEGKWENK